MTEFHVAAYVDDDGERKLAREWIRDAVEHPALIEGLATEEGIRRLTEHDVVVTLLDVDEDETASPVFFSKRTNPALKELASQLESMVREVRPPLAGIFDRVFSPRDLLATLQESISVTAGVPAIVGAAVRKGYGALRGAGDDENVYRVRFRGAMRPEWERELAARRIELLSYRRGTYQAFLTPAQVEWLREKGMAEVKPYDMLDSLSTAVLALLDREGKPETQLFDLVLHRATDRRRVEAVIRTVAGPDAVRESATHLIRFEARLDRQIVATLAGLPWVRSLYPCRPARLFTDHARALIGLPRPAAAASFRWNGSGERVAVIDSGIDRMHPDLTDRIEGPPVSYKGTPVDDVIGHGTHIAGIIAGTGEASKDAAGTVTLCGIAPGAKLVVVANVALTASGPAPEIPDGEIEELFDLAVSREARILNVSWGRDDEDSPASYAPPAEAVDRYVWNHPDVLVVVAAGNQGRAPEGVCAFQTLATPATAKNVLTVGACASDRTEFPETWGQKSLQRFPLPDASNEPVSGNPELVAGMSARGPTEYRSVKPDVVAPGTHILAPRSRSIELSLIWNPQVATPPGYVYIGGTSMAAPVAAGCAAIVRQYLREQFREQLAAAPPSAALLKSVLIGSAKRMKGSRDQLSADSVGFPDFDQGFGRIDLEGLLPGADGAPPPRALAFDDVATGSADALKNGEGRKYAISVRNDGEPLVLTLVWTDRAGNDVQNRLTLDVRRGGKRFLGNATHVFGKSALPGMPVHRDTTNTVQQVRIENASKGEYVIRIVAVRVLQGTQGYAVSVIGDLETPKLVRLKA